MVVVDGATPSAIRHRWAWLSDPQFWSPSKEEKNEKAPRWHSGRPPGPSRSAGAGGGGQKTKKPKKPGGSEGTLVAPRPPHQVALPHQECDTVPRGDTATRRAGGL